MMDGAVSFQVVIASVARRSLYAALLTLACTQIGSTAVCVRAVWWAMMENEKQKPTSQRKPPEEGNAPAFAS